MNERKTIKFIMKLMKMTGDKEIEWTIFEGKTDSGEELEIKFPFKARSIGRAYKTYIDTHYFVLFRCQHPVFEDDIQPSGWDDYEKYHLQVFDSDGYFIHEFPYLSAMEDLYRLVLVQQNSIDNIVDSILSK